MRYLWRIDDIFSKAVMFLAECVYIAIAVSIFAQIIFRYFLNIGLVWVDEFSRYLLVWLVFLGAGLAIDEIESTAVRMIFDRFPHRIRCGLLFLFRIVSLLMLGVLFWYGISFTKLGTTSDMLAIPLKLFWAHLAIPVGSAIMFLRWTVTLLRQCFDNKDKNPEKGDTTT